MRKGERVSTCCPERFSRTMGCVDMPPRPSAFLHIMNSERSSAVGQVRAHMPRPRHDPHHGKIGHFTWCGFSFAFSFLVVCPSHAPATSVNRATARLRQAPCNSRLACNKGGIAGTANTDKRTCLPSNKSSRASPAPRRSPWLPEPYYSPNNSGPFSPPPSPIKLSLRKRS